MKPLFRLVCVCLLLLALPAEVWARGGGGGSFSGGGRSSSSSSSGGSRSSGSSFSGSRSSGGSSWGSSSSGSSSSRSGSTGSSWGSSSRFSTSGSRVNSGSSSSDSTVRSAPSSSATDAALARKVGQGGSTFSSRSEATRDFQQKHANDYPSTFRSEPTNRPSYIPGQTTINGGNYPVYYSPQYGGYGSWVGNHWMAYNVMSDALMMNALMNQHHYSYNDGYNPGYGRTTYYNSSGGGGSFVGGVILIIVLVIGGIIVVNYISARKAVQNAPFVAGGTTGGGGGGAVPPPVRNLSTSPMDKSKAQDWLAVKPNSVVTISDTQGIADSMKRGLGVRGIDYTVRSVGKATQVNGLSTHLFFTLNDEEQVTYLLVKIVDDLIDLSLYFEVESMAAGTRQEMIDRGALWLFQEPSNPNRFDPSELRFTTSIKQTLPNGKGGQEEIFYEIKGQGELQCDYTENPPRSGMARDALATVVEYRTAQQTENPEFLILEVGDKRGTSSYLSFYLGCPVKFSEVDVLPA